MKLFAFVVCLGTVVMAAANANTYKVTFFEKFTVASTELKPGEYKLDVNGDTARLSLGGKMMAETKVQVEASGPKFEKTTVRYDNPGGKYRIMEIRLGGTNTRLIFNE